MTTFVGNGGDDVFSGGTGFDVASGGGGADTLSGAGLDDLLEGNDGPDILYGGDGSDILFAGDRPAGSSYPYGLPTVLDTGAEIDRLYGGDGGDRLFGGYGDIIDGGAFNDILAISFLIAPSGIAADFTQPGLSVGGAAITSVESFALSRAASSTTS